MINILQDVQQIIHRNFILWSPILILVIIIIRAINKNQMHWILNTIRWVFIIYAVISIVNFIISYDSTLEQEAFRLRIMGPYWWAYWTMMFFNVIFPMVLIYKKWGHNQFLLLFVSFTMSIGWWFEQVIIFMSLGRDYL